MNIQKTIDLVSVLAASLSCFSSRAQNTGQYNSLTPNSACLYKPLAFDIQFRRSRPARGFIHTLIYRIKTHSPNVGASLGRSFNHRGWQVLGRAPWLFFQTSFQK